MSSRHWWILCAFFHRGEWEKINISEIMFLGKSMWSRGMGKAATKKSTEKSHKGWERRAYWTHLQCLEHLWKQRTARRRRPREAPWFEHSNKGWTPWLHVWFPWRFALWQTTCLLLCVSPGGDVSWDKGFPLSLQLGGKQDLHTESCYFQTRLVSWWTQWLAGLRNILVLLASS